MMDVALHALHNMPLNGDHLKVERQYGVMVGRRDYSSSIFVLMVGLKLACK